MGEITNIFNKIAGHRVYLDTNLFIYFLDQNKEFFEVTAKILKEVELGNFIAYTGDITVAEILVKPYQTNNLLLVAKIKAFFATKDFISLQSHNGDTFDLSAQIRAKYNMKFADALHYATALKSGCKFFITNDVNIGSNENLEVILLKDLN